MESLGEDECKFLRAVIEQARAKLPTRPDFDPASAKLFDLTVLYSTTLTVDHVDMWDQDGPGHFIMSITINGDGVWMFVGEDEDALFTGLYVGVNQWIAFTESLRYEQTHQVSLQKFLLQI